MDRGTIELRTGAATDPGRVRSHNEDAFLVHPRVFAVADGMGGENAGEVASSIALQTLSAEADRAGDDIPIARWVLHANRAIHERATSDPSTSGMGTTLVAVVVRGDRLRIANIGDSRAYLLRDGELRQLTEDHSHVQGLVKAGLLTPEQAAHHPERNVITRALGRDETGRPDVTEVGVAAGDRLLLCTDGLSGMIDAAEIHRILSDPSDPQSVAARLVEAANEAGGKDNITALVIDVVRVAPSAAPPAAPSRPRRRGSFVIVAVVAVIAAAASLAIWAWARSDTQGGGSVSPTAVPSASASPSASPSTPSVSPTLSPSVVVPVDGGAIADYADGVLGSLPGRWQPRDPFPILSGLTGSQGQLTAVAEQLLGQCRDLRRALVFTPPDRDQLSPIHEQMQVVADLCVRAAVLADDAASAGDGDERRALIRQATRVRNRLRAAFEVAYGALAAIAEQAGVRIPAPQG